MTEDNTCRTYNGYDINGLGQLKDGRGNIAPVTIILPTIAKQVIDEGGGVEEFLVKLDEMIHDAKDMLIERYEWILKQPMSSAKFLWENNSLAGFDGKTTESAFRHGTLAIGQLGGAEALQLLIGKNQTTKEGLELLKRIEKLYKDRCKEFKEYYKLNFGVYYSPAENLCHTALKKFRSKYGIIPNVSDKEFFTNSVHVPVWEKLNPFEKIDIEAQLANYSSAGCIVYTELDSSAFNNLEAIEELVVYAMDKDVPYFAINLPNDTCNDCGFCGDVPNDVCPVCGGNDIKRLRRVTGYMTSDYKTAFNKGKQQEVEQRFKHTEVRED